MARKRNPARLVIALSVAAVLAVFLLYTSIAGGGTASVSPSELDGRRRASSRSSARSSPATRAIPTATGSASSCATARAPAPARVTVLYKGSLSDQFRENREVSVKGELRNGIFVAQEGLARDEVPLEVHRQES